MQLSDFVNVAGATDPLLAAGIMMLWGVCCATMAERLGAPRVTGYLVAGIAMAPSVNGGITSGFLDLVPGYLDECALGIISFAIGGTLNLGRIRKLGRHIAWITLFQGTGAFLLTTMVISLFFAITMDATPKEWMSVYLPVALLVGAISAATAPAATMAIIHECGAKGAFTTILLGVVALDDALSIIFFSLLLGMVKIFVHGQSFSWEGAVIQPFIHVVISVAIGLVVGVLLHFLMRIKHNREIHLAMSLGATFIALGLAVLLDGSLLLACMALGFYTTSFVKNSEQLFDSVERAEEAVFALFFVHAGMYFDLAHLAEAGALALVIMLGRFSGKLSGSWLGATVSGAPAPVRRYLGMGLLPKAGVTVGLVMIARGIFEGNPVADIMVSAVLTSVVLNELIAPFMVRYALAKANEAGSCNGLEEQTEA